MMLTQPQIAAIRRYPGSYGHWCVISATGEPFWSHTIIGRELHAPTAEELAEQNRIAQALEELAEQIEQARRAMPGL